MIIQINDDFDLDKIIYSGQCFRPRKLDAETYLFITGSELLYIKSLGSNSYDISCDRNTWDNVWIKYFDLETSYNDIRTKIPKNDDFLLRSASIGNGIRILRQDKFEMLISFIISQRKSIPAIRSSIEKLCSIYGEVISNDNEEIYAFPTPKALASASLEDLKACGMGYRDVYILDAAKRVHSGALNLEAISSYSDDELFAILKSVYGVGDKVANCISLFAYHRISRAPVDTWIKKIIDNKYNGVNPFPSYGEYAGIMQQYMFYAVLNNKDLNL